MPQRSLASLVLAPVFLGVLCLALACVAGERTDRLSDTLRVSDTLHVTDAVPDTSRATADSVATADSTRAAGADSAAAAQVAMVVDTALLRREQAAQQQGSSKQGSSKQGSAPPTSSCCQSSTRMHRHAMRALSPLADSIAQLLVFVPRDRTWFTVASRGRRMLVDIGRIDVPLTRDSITLAAFQEAAGSLSPLPLGTKLRLRGPYDVVEDVPVKGFDVWNGRIVARLAVSPLLDSLARAEDMLPATAVRLDSVGRASAVDSGRVGATVTTPAVPTPRPDSSKVAAPLPVCVRDTLPTDLATRSVAVRDSIVRFLTDSVKAPYDRLAAEAKIHSWSIPGCFGISRVLVVASRRTGDMEFAVERAALVDSVGKVLPLRFFDLRFHAHDPLYVFDADGDGVDDLAARGYGDRSGGLTIVRLDLATRRLTRLASGFAWEQ